MTNIKKQITGIKISQFLKANNFVLFFHYNSKTIHKWYAIKEKISIDAFSIGSARLLRGSNPTKSSLDLQEAGNQQSESAPPLQQIKTLLVKNKIALRVLDLHNVTRKHERIDSFSLKDNLIHINIQNPSTVRDRRLEQKGKNSEDIQKKDTTFLQQKNRQFHPKPPALARERIANASLTSSSLVSNTDSSATKVRARQLSALFQGPAVLLGFNKLNYLENVLNIYRQEKNFILFGGVSYNETLLNQTDIKRMGQLIKNNCHPISVIKEIQKPTICAMITLKKALSSFSFITDPTYNLLRILKYRNYQLSNRSLQK